MSRNPRGPGRAFYTLEDLAALFSAPSPRAMADRFRYHGLDWRSLTGVLAMAERIQRPLDSRPSISTPASSAPRSPAPFSPGPKPYVPIRPTLPGYRK